MTRAQEMAIDRACAHQCMQRALIDALELLTSERHMMAPTEFGGYVCKVCGGYPSDRQHFRAGEDARSDMAKARAVLARAKEQS